MAAMTPMAAGVRNEHTLRRNRGSWVNLVWKFLQALPGLDEMVPGVVKYGIRP